MVDLSGLGREAAQIHEASLEVLENVGLRFAHQEAVELLAARGFTVRGEVVRFPRTRLLDLVSAAPASFKLFGRRPGLEVELGGGVSQPAPAYGAPFISQGNGSLRPAEVEDFRRLIKLYHQSDHFNINGGLPVQPAGHGLEVLLYESLRLTDKVLLTGNGSREEMINLMAMLELVFGPPTELAARPRTATIISPQSPLGYDRDQLETLILFARYGQPVVISPGGMPGATSPMTMAGTLVQNNAELLAGTAVAQAVRPGAPVVYGIVTAMMDMRLGYLAIGSPEFVQSQRYVMELARAYGLPTRGGGALTDAHALSAQSGYESMLVLMASMINGIDLIIHAAGILQGFKSVSYEKLMVDLEMIGMVEHYLKPIRIDRESLAVEAIGRQGHGGNYMLDPTTLRSCRSEPFLPGLAIRGKADGAGDEKYRDRIKGRLEQSLAAYREPGLPKEVEDGLRSFLEDKGVRLPPDL